MFKVLEHMFKGRKHMFQGCEYMFQVREQKIFREENYFELLEKNFSMRYQYFFRKTPQGIQC